MLSREIIFTFASSRETANFAGNFRPLLREYVKKSTFIITAKTQRRRK